METLRDKFFWESYGKFAVGTAIGFAITTLIGVPAETAVNLAAGAILMFPAAYSISSKKAADSNKNSTPSPE